MVHSIAEKLREVQTTPEQDGAQYNRRAQDSALDQGRMVHNIAEKPRACCNLWLNMYKYGNCLREEKILLWNLTTWIFPFYKSEWIPWVWKICGNSWIVKTNNISPGRKPPIHKAQHQVTWTQNVKSTTCYVRRCSLFLGVPGLLITISWFRRGRQKHVFWRSRQSFLRIARLAIATPWHFQIDCFLVPKQQFITNIKTEH